MGQRGTEDLSSDSTRSGEVVGGASAGAVPTPGDPTPPASVVGVLETSAPSLREEHAADTRRAVVSAARGLFAAQGYEATSTEEIVRTARVTRGGMYHHFAGKAELFAAVLEAVEADFIARLAERGAEGADLWEAVVAGCQDFLDLALDMEIQRIMLLDGPSVLGWAAWRAVEERYGFGLLRQYVEETIDAGILQPQPVEPLVHLIAGALNEAAMAIAHAGDRERMRVEMGAAVTRLLEGLRTSEPAGGA